jgi:hypothetical protein
MTREDAQALVLRRLNAAYDVAGDELVILDEETVEKDYGWVFFYTSRRFRETGSISDMLAGNGPVVVEREGGDIHLLSAAVPPDEAIREYESRRRRGEYEREN